MTWHIIYEAEKGRITSRAARSHDLAIHMACKLLKQSSPIRRVMATIENEVIDV